MPAPQSRRWFRLHKIWDYLFNNTDKPRTPSAPLAVERLEGRDLLTVYNPATAFSATSNTSGPWSYGSAATLTGAFVPGDSLSIAPGIDAWGAAALPGVFHNPSSGDVAFANTVLMHAGEIALHPGPQGQYAAVEFTAPADGYYQVAVSFAGRDVSYGGTDAHVLINGVEAFGATVTSGAGVGINAPVTAFLSAGDTIDFRVGFGPNGTYYNDSTNLAATVTTVSGPPAPTGDAASAFSATENPHDGWSFGWAPTLAGEFVPGVPFAMAPGVPGWGDTTWDDLPGAYKNVTDQSQSFRNTVTLAPGELALHPGAGGEYAVARYVAPAAGVYTVTGSFGGRDVSFGGTDAHVLVGGVEVFGGAVTDSAGVGMAAPLTVTLAAGATVDFRVGYGSNGTYYYDTTAVFASVSAIETLTYSDTRLTPGDPVAGEAGVPFAAATVASFTDNDATRTADDYSATVDWGNGTVTDATVTGGSGSFEVQDTPPYDLPSVYGVTVTVTANYRSDPVNHSSPIVATREVRTHLTATVEAPPVTVTGEPMDATECEPTEGGVTIASFELPEGAELSRYKAEVRMGDGSGIIPGVQLEIGTSGEVEVLVPSHTYNTPGTYDAHVLIRDTKSNLEPGGEVVGAGVTQVTVTDPDSSNIAGLESFPVTLTEADSSEKTVASFPVPSGESASNYSAAIDWGDGSPIVFVHGGGGGEFKATPPATNPIVSGVRISVYHDGTETGQLGGTLVGVIGTTLTVEDAELTTDTSVAPDDIKRNANDEVSEFLLAAFTSDDSTDTADRYQALINWGDGSQSVADVLGTGGRFWVGGTHPFAETGTYSVTIRIQDDVLAGKQVWEAQDTIQVLDIRQGADFVGSLGMAEVQPAGASGGSVEGQVTWNDPDSHEGDAGIESQGSGYYEVFTPDSTPSTPPASPPGYLLPDDYSPSIEVTKGALSAGDSWTVRAGDAALSVAGDSPTATIDAKINIPTPVTEVLTFTDPATSGAGYTATVDWGDGTQDVATVVTMSDTEFRVDAPAHTYTAVGEYPVSVLVCSLEVSGGGAATLLAKRVVKVDDPDVFIADQRRDERDNATWVSAGPMSQVSENTGAVRLSHQLDFDQNPGTAVGRDPHLVYNSSTVDPRPVIEGTIPMTATPDAIAVVTLTWDGVDQDSKTLVVPADYTGQWVVSAQPDEPASEGVHAWTMSVSVYAAGANPATDEALGSWTKSGQAQVVDNTASQFGAGWNLDLNWRIVPDADGVGGAMLVYGTGESRYFTVQGLGFANPPEEFGTLTSSCDGFEYRSKFGEVWDFDPLGRLATITDRNGLQTVFARDSGTGNVTAVTAIDGNTVDIDGGSGSVTFNESGGRTVVEALSGSDVRSITDPGGVRVFGYSDGLLTSDTWGTRQTGYDYDANGMARDFSLGTHTYDIDPAAEWGLGGIDITTSPVQAPGTGAVKDARTDATTVTLSLLGRSKKTTFADGTFTTADRNDAGQVTSFTDARTLTTGYAYDSVGDLVALQNPNGTSESYLYDPVYHNVLASIDEDNNVSVNAYDPFGNVTSTTTGYGTLVAATATGTWSNGLLTSSTDPDLNTTDYTYNSQRQLTARVTTDFTGTIVDNEAFTYDGAGNVASTTVGVGGPDPATTLMTFDGNNELLTQTNPAGDTWSATYSPAGEMLTSFDGRGVETIDVYDAAGELTLETDDANQSMPEPEAESFDGAGNETNSTDADGNVTVRTFDRNNQLLTAITYDPEGSVLSSMTYTYDNDGNVLTQTDGDNNVTENTWDDENRLESTTTYDIFGLVVSGMAYTYDHVGHVLTETDADLTVTTNKYDHNERMVSTETRASNGALIRALYTTYDGNGNVLSTTDGDLTRTVYTVNVWGEVTSERVYDRLGALLSSMTSTFDLKGNETGSTDGDNNVTTNTFDGDGRVTSSVMRTASGVVISSVGATYDGDGNVLTFTDGDGNVTTNTYDGSGNLLTRVVRDWLGNVTSSETNTYDPDNNLLTSTDADGNVTTNTYDGDRLVSTVVRANGSGGAGTGPIVSSSGETYDRNGNLTTFTDGDLNVTTNTYDGDRLMSTVKTDWLGNVISSMAYTYDPNGNVLTSTDGDRNVATYVYQGNELISTIVRADGVGGPGSGPIVSSSGETYDTNGNVTQSVDGDLNVTTNTYDGDRLMSTVKTDWLGNVISSTAYTYDQNYNVLTVTDGDNNVTTYAYQGNRLVSTVVRANGSGGAGTGPIVSSSGETYDRNGNVTQSVDGDLNVTTNTYDGDRLMSTVKTDWLGNVISSMAYTYDPNGNVLTSTDGDRNVATYVYQGNELISTIVRADGVGGPGSGPIVSSSSETYDRNGNVTQAIDGVGNVTTNTYDGDRLMSTVTRNPGGNVVNSTAYTYDLNGNVLTSTDGVGNVATYTYQGNELISTVVRANGSGGAGTGPIVSSSGETYDRNGNLTTYTDGDLNVTTNTYDGDRLMSTVKTDWLGNVISSTAYTYDQNYNVLTVTDGDLNVTVMTYDGNGSVLTTKRYDAGGTLLDSSTNTYDLNGNVLTSTDALSNVTVNTYDGNRLASKTVGYGTSAAATTTYAYDRNGNITSVTDPIHNVTSMTYDANGSVLTTTTALGTTTNTYDTAGNLLSTTDTAGRTITRTYDGNRVQTEVWRDASGTVTDTRNFTYDAADNVLTASNDAGTVTMTYSGNRLLTRTDPNGVTLTYTYDDAGNVLTCTDSQGGVTSYTYDGNQVATKTFTDGANELRVDYTYDAASNVLTESRFADLAGTVSAGEATYTYDGNRLASIEQTNGSGTMVSDSSYSYNAAGELTSKAENGVTTDYGYDATAQLVQEGTQTHTYDANGNPNDAGTTIGPENELLSDANGTYTYDGVGNLTSWTQPDGTVWTYTYNNANQRLTAVKTLLGGSVAVSAEYAYDVFGNRLAETVTVGSTTTVHEFAYDGAGTLTAELDGSGTVTTRYVSDVTGPDTWLAQVGSSGAEWLLTDWQGSVQVMLDNSGTVANQITYDAFGNITSVTLPAALPGVGFQGGQYDTATGGVRFGARDYNPVTHRWDERDPLGLGGGDSNLFRFVGNGPTNATDPSGMWLIIGKDQIPYWQAIAQASGIDLGVMQHPTFQDKFILNAPRTSEAHNAIWNALRQAGLYEADVSKAVNALYGGNFNERQALALTSSLGSLPGDLGKQQGNVEVTFSPTQVSAPIQFPSQDFLNAWINQPGSRLKETGVDGVWVFPAMLFKSRSGLLDYTIAASFLVQPDPKAPSVVFVTGPRATTTTVGVNGYVPAPQPVDKMYGMKPIHDDKYAEIMKFYSGAAWVAENATEFWVAGKAIKVAGLVGKPVLNWMFGGELKAGAAALKAEVAGGTRTGVETYWKRWTGPIDNQAGVLGQVDNTCGMAVVDMALLGRGIKLDTATLQAMRQLFHDAKHVNDAGKLQGIPSDAVAKLFQTAGLKTDPYFRGKTFAQLEEALTQGNGAVVQLFEGNRAHFILVERVVPQSEMAALGLPRTQGTVVQIVDSNEARRFYVTADELIQRWRYSESSAAGKVLILPK